MTSSAPAVGRIAFVDTELSASPVCRHGPTLLLQDVDTNGRYYCCSSCRKRKDCDFHMTEEEWIVTQSKPKLMAKYRRRVSHLMATESEKYFYDKRVKQLERMEFCRNCSLIISTTDSLSDHKTHELMCGISGRQLRRPTKLMNSLTDNRFCAQYLFSKQTIRTHELMCGISGRQLRRPTKLMNSLTDNRFCAQYLFSKQTIRVLMNEILVKNQFSRVVCIGCPSLHEYIDCHKNALNMKSLLLDIDCRYKQFYSPKKYLKYNLFNNYFFGGVKDEKTFRRFIANSVKEPIVVLIDPPFGGLIDPMAKTIDKISEIWRKYHQISDESIKIPVLLFFPYFNEHRIKTTIPVLSMSDFMVDYENHRKFKATDSGRKFGSPVRIFTNIKLSSIVLPETDGYYYCDYCEKYISENNKHCFECNDCTARDGKPYNHCYQCKRCVKNTWNHCNRCGYCHLIQHSCTRHPFEDKSEIIVNKKRKH
ncbi:unnamed protein product, partial [Medioppia subpectinata]